MTDREPLPPLDERTREVLERAALSIPPVPAGARDRVLARVEGSLFPPGGGGPHGASPAASAPPNVAVSWLRRAWPLVATFSLGAVVGAAALQAYYPAPRERIVYVDRPVPVVSSHAGGAAEGTLSSQPPSSRGEETMEAAAPVAVPPSRGSGAASSASDLPSDVAAERKLLDVARHALDAEDGAGALAAVELHERRYPKGVLVQEREAMGIRALLLLGRADEARARAARFRTRFPSSLLLPAIEAAVAIPSSP
jgi:hypothetical protein